MIHTKLKRTSHCREEALSWCPGGHQSTERMQARDDMLPWKNLECEENL